MSNTEFDTKALDGAWKLEFYETLEGDRFTHFSDIILFSYPYYSDFHAEFGIINRTFSHVGMLKLSGNTLTFQVQLSTEPAYIGLVAVGLCSLEGDRLEILMERGNTPGKWMYRRLN